MKKILSTFAIVLLILLAVSSCDAPRRVIQTYIPLELMPGGQKTDSNSDFKFNRKGYGKLGDTKINALPLEYRREDASDKTITLYGKNYNLKYASTHITAMSLQSFDEYDVDNVDNISVSLKEGTNKVYSLRAFGDAYFTKTTSLRSENDYTEQAKTWAKDYIAVKNYEISYRTHVRRVYREGGVENKYYDEFVDMHDERVNHETDSLEYQISFIKYLVGYKTTDTATIIVTSDGKLTGVTVGTTGAFDAISIKKLGFNYGLAQEKLYTAINDYCNVDGYKLKEVKINEMFIVCDGRLYLLYYVEPTIKRVEDNLTIENSGIIFVGYAQYMFNLTK